VNARTSAASRALPLEESRRARCSEVETLKWAGLGAMLTAHVVEFALGQPGGWPHAVGRLAFPLFVFAFASALRDDNALVRVVSRLMVWGLIAQVGCFLVKGPLPLNVLFTFAIGVALYDCCLQREVSRLALGAVLLLLSCVCEFGPAGAVCVALMLAAGRLWRTSAEPELGRLCAVAALVLLCLWNGDGWALLAAPICIGVATLRLQLPRVRGLFYVTYAAQWFVLFGVLHA
jgi:hypothetical protein